MSDVSKELTFQNDIIDQLLSQGWLLGQPEKYNRKLALYEDDLIGFIQETQEAEWEK